MIQTLAMLSGILMPCFNIPLIIRIRPARLITRYQFALGSGGVVLCDGDVAAQFTIAGAGAVTFGVVNALCFTGVLASVALFSSIDQEDIWRPQSNRIRSAIPRTDAIVS